MILANHGIISSSGGLPPSTLLTDLYAVYKAESNANDSKNSYNGTAQGGLTYGSGQSGNAFVGNGTNAYISFPDDTFKFTNAFSFNIWVNISSSTTNSTFIENYNYPVPNESGYIFEHLSTGNIRFYMLTAPASSTSLTYSYAGNYNAWHMLTLTKASSSGALKLYIDGVLVASNSSPGTIYYHTVNFSSIGVAKYTGGASGFLENGGKLDEIGIWNKELTTTEITELQNKYYPF
jgi:hypothetical protein